MNLSITLILVLLTSIVSYQGFQKPYYINILGQHPYSIRTRKEYYRLLTAGFVHGSWMHLLINMFVLWMFGERIEFYYIQIWGETLGRVYFLLMYCLTIILANLPSLQKHQNDPGYYSIGASGGVSGIVFIFILFHPWEKLYLYFVIPIYGIIAGVLYLWYSNWASKNSHDRIDHSAHFYGALVGVLITIALKPDLIKLFWDRLVNGFPF